MKGDPGSRGQVGPIGQNGPLVMIHWLCNIGGKNPCAWLIIAKLPLQKSHWFKFQFWVFLSMYNCRDLKDRKDRRVVLVIKVKKESEESED